MSTWMKLDTDYCRHCGVHRRAHVKGQCLYMPTKFANSTCPACGIEVTDANVGWREIPPVMRTPSSQWPFDWGPVYARTGCDVHYPREGDR